MNEDKLTHAIGKAQRARELLENELLGDVIDGIKRDLEQRVFSENCGPVEREQAVYSYRSMDLIKLRLVALANPTLERREIEDNASGLVRKQFGIV